MPCQRSRVVKQKGRSVVSVRGLLRAEQLNGSKVPSLFKKGVIRHAGGSALLLN